MPQIIAAEHQLSPSCAGKNSWSARPGELCSPNHSSILNTRLFQALKHSCQAERLLDLSRIGITSQWTNIVVRDIAPHFLLADDEIPTGGDLKITGLSFSHNPNLGPQGSVTLLACLQRLIFEAPHRHCLQALDLYNIGIADHCVPTLLDCIERGSPILSKIKIGDNAITAAGMWHLVQRHAALSSVQQLHLGGNPLLDQGIQHLASLVGKMPLLSNIGIRDVKCSDLGLGSLFEALASRHTQFPDWARITEIQLRGNQARLPSTVEKLAQCFQMGAFENLSVLDFAGCQAPDGGMAQLYATLSKSLRIASLREADFSGNVLGPLGCVGLSSLLSSETCGIVSLNLSCQMQSSSAQFGTALGGLSRNSSISNLCLAGNDLRGSASAALATALSIPNCGILALDISGCSIGPEGMSLIFRALAKDTARTKVLEAANNFSGLQSVSALLEMLAKNTHLSKLHIQDNAIPLDEGMSRVADVIEGANFTLRQMSFGGQSSAANGLTPNLRQQINCVLLRNKNCWEATKAERARQCRALDEASPPRAAPPHASLFSPQSSVGSPQCGNERRVVMLSSLWDTPLLF